MSRVTIGLDVDDVVCRCIHGMNQIANQHLGLTLTEDDITTWDFHESLPVEDPETFKERIFAEMSEQGWCLNLEPFPGAVEAVHKLQAIADVFFVTSPFSSPFWEYERRVWLQNHFDIPRSRIIQGSSKFLVRTDIFVDDKPQNIQEWCAYRPGEGLALLWDRPHNRCEIGMSRVHSWKQLHDIVSVHIMER